MRRSPVTPSAPWAAAVVVDTPPRPRVTLCVDIDDDIDVIRTVRRRYVLDRGCVVLTVGPQAGSVEDLIRALLRSLSVLWRLPGRQQRGRAAMTGEDRAAAEWELSWALTRAGVTDLWVIDADAASTLAWWWLRDTAEREGLRLTLHTTTVPDAPHAAALTGCRVRLLNPDRLRAPSRPPPAAPGWPAVSAGTDRPSRD